MRRGKFDQRTMITSIANITRRMIHCKAVRGLPAMHLTLDHKIFLSVDKEVHGDTLSLHSSELAGFNVGEFKVVPTSAIDGANHSLCWRAGAFGIVRFARQLLRLIFKIAVGSHCLD